MAQYNLNISHNNLNENITYSEAINLLNEYEYHRVGQPIAIVYHDENNGRRLILAVGKRDYTDPVGAKCKGEDFYELINKNELANGNSQFMVIKNGDVYIRGIDSTDSVHDYKLLNKKCIIEQVEDTDIVTIGYLSEWSAFQNIE